MQENKMGTLKMSKLVLSMGIPMVISMVLQGLYNIVDTMFVINMGEEGTIGNIALSCAFPVQILMIAIGVGTGVGLNANLSKHLGEKEFDDANKVAGNALFLAFIFYLLFLIFGLFFTEPYMRLMSSNEKVIEMGSQYLKICCTLSFGSIGYSIVERFLMATGKTVHSMICQISGAVINIVFDYVFIYPCKMGIAGAAYATIFGQIFSLVLGYIIHVLKNKEISSNVKYLLPHKKYLGEIFKMGFPAFLMQAMLSVMMFAVLLIIGTISNTEVNELLTGAFGIYYKMMQIALFAAFGLSNALISIVSFNYGMGNKERVYQACKWGIIDTVITTLIITAIYQIFAKNISSLFALGSDSTSDKEALLSICTLSLHIASIGYIFMGFSVAIQGVLQGLNKVYSPLIISLLRLIVFVLPISYLFTLTSEPQTYLWWTFVISEVLTAIISFFILQSGLKKTFSLNENL